MGLTMGEMFFLKDLAEDCAQDKIYEFFFCGPPLIITGGTGSPIMAIKKSVASQINRRVSRRLGSIGRARRAQIAIVLLLGLHSRSGRSEMCLRQIERSIPRSH
jgi:hypothetical protein